MAAKDDLGRAGERRAARYLEEHGYEILDRNWRGSAGEIDIVARRGRGISVVEVKTRTSSRYGHPFEALDDRKVGRLWRLANEWARAHADRIGGRHPMRLEAIGIIGPDPDVGIIEHLVDLR